MAWQMTVAKLPEPEREFRFASPRRWRFDFAWPEQRVALEVEGLTRYGSNRNGTMKLGRHQSAKGITADMEKYNTAALKGWLVLRVCQEHIRSGEALQWVEELLTQEPSR